MSLPAVTPIRRSVLSDDVFDTLKALVMEHRLAPEERVNIDALARRLGVSPTPVREALARLESEGLVRKRPLAGYTVSPLLTRDEFTDLFDMRMVLEGAAARWAASRSGDTERAAVVEEASIPYVAPEPLPDGRHWHAALTAQDARFHGLLASVAGSPLLAEAVARLHAHLHIHRLYFPDAGTGTTGREHRRIADAVRRGDPGAAEAAMHDHLTAARRRHLPAFD